MELVDRHPDASIFHSVGWLEALKRTYGYEPVAFTTSPPTGPLKNGIVFCRVKSWLMGSRLVSLPFSDHCEPLCDSPEELSFLVRYLQTVLEHDNLKFLEIRSVSEMPNARNYCSAEAQRHSVRYFLHIVDLRPELGEIFRTLDRDSVQRRIQRADRAGLAQKTGRSRQLLEQFYDLFVGTRGRQQLPPIPYTWFQNLLECAGEAAEIRVAEHENKPIAAVFSLRFRDKLYYKYGCSDEHFNNLGATPWLLWKVVSAGKATGARIFDMGRTQEDHIGLLTFKNHWSNQPLSIVYWAYPDVPALRAHNGWHMKIAKQVFSHMPGKMLSFAGKVLYRHIG